jgi:aryl-alcohol dehydrogenase-like predicted oxidoreductase
MEKRRFGRTGFDVSPLGFGSAPIGFLDTDRQRVATILNLLLDEGVNLIDTAASYPGSEEGIAATVGHRRGEFVLVSKCGSKISESSAAPWSAEVVTATVDRALKRLQTDALDVMLLHSCDLATLKKGEALGALVKARDAGKIRFAGYSGDNEAAAYAAGLPDVAVIETSISIVDQVNIDSVLPLCVKNNVGVLAKRPIANAAWRGAENRGGIYDNYVKPYVDRLRKMNLKPTEVGFADDGNDAWAELALRFTLSVPAVHTAIIGTTNPDNARANIQFTQKGALPKEAFEKIRQKFRSANANGSWEGLQ